MQTVNFYEQISLLGYLLTKQDEQRAHSIIEKIAPEYFPNNELSEIYRAIRNQYRSGTEVNVLDVLTEVAGKFKDTDLKNIRATLKDAMLDATASERSEVTAQKLLELNYWNQVRTSLESIETAEELSSTLYRLDEEYREQSQEHKKKPSNMLEYINSGALASDIEEFRNNSRLKTGFENYDAEAGGIYTGLYVVGAISSLGKTTFVHQIADNIAEAGTPVLYFSLEQSTAELMTKSLARQTAKAEMNSGVSLENLGAESKSSMYIRTHDTGTVSRILEEYAEKIAPNMNIIEGNFSTNAEYIRTYTARFIREHAEAKPVVIIDYLQIMQNENTSFGKENIDRNITELKRLSRDYSIPVIVISSFNRGNYMTPVSFESFKESGGIEYTADVVLGLQLQALNNEIFEKEGKVKQKRELLKEAKEEIPRKIQLVCLKNRFGKTSFDVAFHYNPKFDLFVGASPMDKAHDAGATSLTQKPKRNSRKKSQTEDYNEALEL